MKKLVGLLLLLVMVTGCTNALAMPGAAQSPVASGKYDVELDFPASEYPKTAAHITKAIQNGETAICTIDRKGADENRHQSLKGIPTKKGYDRDEFPMAMCAEGGSGADIAYVESSDNRGSGSWVGNHLEQYPDGTRILFIIKGGKSENVVSAQREEQSKPTAEPTTKPTSKGDVVSYANCAAVKEAGKAPLHKGDPGYSTKLDRDGDGVACEK